MFVVNNKYTNTDYDYFEQAWSSSVAGQVLDSHLDFVFGGGLKPTFELIDAKGKEQTAIDQELEQYDDLKNQLMEIDNRPTVMLQNCAYDAAVMAKVFGRSVIAYEPEGVLIPESLYIIHPRDLGRPYTKDDYSLSSVVATQLGTSINADEMMYIVNRPNSPIQKQRWYGFSEMQRIVGASRALRRMLEFDAPEIVESLWAKYGIIIANTEGKTEAQATIELNRIADGMKPGAFNVLNGKPDEDIQYIDVDMKANVDQLVQLTDSYERVIMGNWAVPGPLLGREEDSNMATLYGKIRLYLAGPVAADREWLSEIISKQWYERNIMRLQPEVLKTVRVRAEFEPVVIESWIDMVPAMQNLKNIIGEIPVEMLTEMLHLEQYKDLIQQAMEKMEVKKAEEMEMQKEQFGMQMDMKKKMIEKKTPPFGKSLRDE